MRPPSAVLRRHACGTMNPWPVDSRPGTKRTFYQWWSGMNFFRQPWVIILLIVLVILLFGANKLPGLARNMGQSMRIFKSEVQEMRKDDPKDEGAAEPRNGEDPQYDPRTDRPAEPVRDADAEERYRRD